jgi:AbrB family looped-hinge helix DNA binding protein
MWITAKGRVTIPADLRERAGLRPGTEVTFEYDGVAVRIVPAYTSGAKSRGEMLVEHLRGRGDNRMSTAKIMALTRGDD